MKNIAIIGGGASALMCACFIKNANVTIFEKNIKVGKKILATGNGRCNLANVKMDNCSYNHDLTSYFSRFDVQSTLSFFKSIGLEVYADPEGRVYPISNSANSVLDVLTNHVIKKGNINFEVGKEISGIEKKSDGFVLAFSDGSCKSFNKVIVASGNLTDLGMYDKFVKWTPFRPSLCSLKTLKPTKLDNIRVHNVCVKAGAMGDNFSEIGEVLFKENSLSGIVIFNLSAYFARKNAYKGDVFIDFLPNISKKDLIFQLSQRRKNLGQYKIKDFLTGFFHKSVCECFLSLIGVNYENAVISLSDEKLELLASTIKNYKIQVDGYCDNAQVFAGGVSLNSLSENLEAKNAPGLYFIGEVCDVDGLCGGYNLMWAWTSGKIVGEMV